MNGDDKIRFLMEKANKKMLARELGINYSSLMGYFNNVRPLSQTNKLKIINYFKEMLEVANTY